MFVVKAQFIDVYKLIYPNPTPEMQKLKEKFDKAVKNWKRALKEFESAPPEEIEDYMKKLMEANQRIGKLKRKIISKSDS